MLKVSRLAWCICSLNVVHPSLTIIVLKPRSAASRAVVATQTSLDTGHGHPLRALMTEPLFEARGGERLAETLLSTNSPASGFSASSISQLGSSTEGHTRLPRVATPSSPKDRSQHGSSRPSPASVPTAVKTIGDPTFRKQHRSLRTLGAVRLWPKSLQKAKKVQTPANRPIV
jgi:hypothetical protein